MIGSRLFEIIEDNFGSRGQAQFSKATGIPVGTLSAYVNKNQPPKPEYLIRISELFNVNINWLLRGIGTKTIHPQSTKHSDTHQEISNLTARACKLLSCDNQDAIKDLTHKICSLERTIEKERKQQEEIEAIKKELAESKKHKCEDGKHCPGEPSSNEKAA